MFSCFHFFFCLHITKCVVCVRARTRSLAIFFSLLFRVGIVVRAKKKCEYMTAECWCQCFSARCYCRVHEYGGKNSGKAIWLQMAKEEEKKIGLYGWKLCCCLLLLLGFSYNIFIHFLRRFFISFLFINISIIHV